MGKEKNFYKVLITQVVNGEIVGKGVICKDFLTVSAARRAGLENLLNNESYYQVKKYKSKERNIISFDRQDTGEQVYPVVVAV